MKTQKKREHVKGAWWVIAYCVVAPVLCAENGINPVYAYAGPAALYYGAAALFALFAAIIAIVGGILGGGGK